jgi:alpha,alpha-trehalose phosphorylase
MDLADVGGNVKDGCHIASMGGTWRVIVYGFAGMRDHGGRLSFTPRLPRQLRRLGFSLRVGESVLAGDLGQDGATYVLREGSELTIVHQGEELRLSHGAAVRRPVA